MFISAPFVKTGSKLTALTSTHPPIEERIKILRFMSRGADYYNYQRAFSRARGKPSPLIPSSSLDKDKRIEIRPPGVEKDPRLW